MRVESVTSAQNRKVKTLLALQEKARLRKEMGLFVVEGRRELEHCVHAGFEIDTLFYCPEIVGLTLATASADRPSDAIRCGAPSRYADPTRVKASSDLSASALRQTTAEAYNADNPVTDPGTGSPDLATILEKAGQVIEVTREIYEKIAYRGGTEGLVAEVKAKEIALAELKLSERPLVVVLEGVEKPGNLGAVLRSADAAGADAVLVCDPLTDLYNPNLIRASIGAVFTVPVACCSSEEAIKWLKDNNIKIYTAQLQDSSWYYDTDMRGGTAIVIGTEATGLTAAWREAADAHIRIPMLGELDSLNASVSAAILLFEAVRQRNA